MGAADGAGLEKDISTRSFHVLISGTAAGQAGAHGYDVQSTTQHRYTCMKDATIHWGWNEKQRKASAGTYMYNAADDTLRIGRKRKEGSNRKRRVIRTQGESSIANVKKQSQRNNQTRSTTQRETQLATTAIRV